MQAACTVALAAHAADYLSAAHANAGGPPVALLVGAAAPLGAELPMLSRWLPAQLAVAADPQRAGVFALTGAHATDRGPPAPTARRPPRTTRSPTGGCARSRRPRWPRGARLRLRRTVFRD